MCFVWFAKAYFGFFLICFGVLAFLPAKMHFYLAVCMFLAVVGCLDQSID